MNIILPSGLLKCREELFKSQLQRSNPTKVKGCGNDDCLPGSQVSGEGGNCLKSILTYEMECKLSKDSII